MHHLHDRHRTGAERNRQDASDRQENHHDAKIKEKEGYPEDFPGEKFMTKKRMPAASSFLSQDNYIITSMKLLLTGLPEYAV